MPREILFPAVGQRAWKAVTSGVLAGYRWWTSRSRCTGSLRRGLERVGVQDGCHLRFQGKAAVNPRPSGPMAIEVETPEDYAGYRDGRPVNRRHGAGHGRHPGGSKGHQGGSAAVGNVRLLATAPFGQTRQYTMGSSTTRKRRATCPKPSCGRCNKSLRSNGFAAQAPRLEFLVKMASSPKHVNS